MDIFIDILLDISWIVIGYVASKEKRASESGQEGPNLISYNTVISAAAAFFFHGPAMANLWMF